MQDGNNGIDEGGFEEHPRGTGGRRRPHVLRNIIPILLSLVAATLLWLYATSLDSTSTSKRFTQIGVALQGVATMQNQRGFSVLSGYDSTVDVTVTGSKSDINQLRNSDITAYVDLSSVTAAGEQSLPIRVKTKTGLQVTGLSTNYLVVYVDKTTSNKVPVMANILQSHESSVMLGDVIIDPATVTVSGPEQLIMTIDHAQVTVDLGRITQTMEITEQFTLIDKNGEAVNSQYITTDVSSVQITQPVYAQATVPVNVQYKYGYVTPANAAIQVTPSTVTVVGEPSVIAGISFIDTQVIDETGLVDMNTTQTVGLVLPAGVSVSGGGNTCQVDTQFTGATDQKVRYDLSDAQVVNPPSGLMYKIDSQQEELTVRCDAAIAETITRDSVSCGVDLSKYTDKGTYAVPVTFMVSADGGWAFVVGSYTCTVEIY